MSMNNAIFILALQQNIRNCILSPSTLILALDLAHTLNLAVLSQI